MAVELGLSPDIRWDSAVSTLIGAARQAGFSALGLSADWVGADAPAAYDEAGLRCHELLVLVVGDDGAATVESAEQLARTAAAVRAEWIPTLFTTGLTGETAKVVERCAALFADAGAGMAVEFSPLGPVSSIRAGLDVVAVAGADRAGLLIDSWHFSFGDSTWDDLARVPLDRIAYVQFADAPPPVSGDIAAETSQRRAMPGNGVLELDRFASTLLERGWEGLVSVEVLNTEMLALPMPEFARLAHDSAARYWS
ncbi:sugar phosphate isomerase/epimerase family protein [Spirillospora sp. CA-255316]